MWNRGNRAKVLRELTRGGKLNVELLGHMLEHNNRAVKEALLIAAWAVS